MIKKMLMVLAAILTVFATGSPVYASVPDWDKAPDKITWESAGYSAKVAAELKAQGYAVHTPAEWAAIKTEASSLKRGSWADCPPRPPEGSTETFCLWNGYNFSGTRWNIPKSWLGDTDGINTINGLSFYGSGINNASKSWANFTYYKVRLFDRDDCQNSGWLRDMIDNTVAVSYDASSNDWENRIGSISIYEYSGYYCTNQPGH